MRPFQKTAVMLAVVTFAIATFALTDANSTGNSAGAACVFTDGKQMSVRYDAAPVNPQKFHKGEIWTPGSSPMYLFTQTDVTLSGSTIPAGPTACMSSPPRKNGRWSSTRTSRTVRSTIPRKTSCARRWISALCPVRIKK
jgi:hypothetical protein